VTWAEVAFVIMAEAVVTPVALTTHAPVIEIGASRYTPHAILRRMN
jgi:hypothetical protein